MPLALAKIGKKHMLAKQILVTDEVAPCTKGPRFSFSFQGRVGDVGFLLSQLHFHEISIVFQSNFQHISQHVPKR